MKSLGRIGIIGGSGWLGSAIAQSLVTSGKVAPADLICSYRSAMPGPVSWRLTKDNAELASVSDVIILSVRPQDWAAVDIAAPDKLVVSVMAGIALRTIGERTQSRRLARTLPNAAAEVGFSYTPIFVDLPQTGDEDIVRAIFETCGAVDAVADEDQIDYFTGLSGSGPAFPALLAEAMLKAAQSAGIPADIARRGAMQTLIGAGRLLETERRPPSEVVKTFVDYGGTTAAAILTMREKGFDEAVLAGLEAAYGKAKALSGP